MIFVLDTSFFTNPDSYKYWGKSVSEAILEFVDRVGQKESEYEFMMPPSVVEELRSFFDGEDHEVLTALGTVLTVRAPFVDNVQIPARWFYEVVLEIRGRSYKGLRVAEKYVKAGWNKEYDQIGEVVNRLRREYREALRTGFLDSKADLDLLFLAYEVKGVLVTVDQGLIEWANKFGVKLMRPEVLREKLR